MEDIKKFIRDVADFPSPGILFKDITPLLKSPQAFRRVIQILMDRYAGENITKIAGVESRGFIFGAALASHMNIGFIPVRKKGKLPWTTISQEYSLEYGTDTLEMHADALEKTDRVLLVDDLLATGGTAQAVCQLVEQQQARVVSLAFVIELNFLNGREKLKNREIFSLLNY